MTELIVGVVGAIIGAVSVWAVNLYRARVDDDAAINRLMLVRRMACAEKLCALSFLATREMLKPKSGETGREAWHLSFDEVETRAETLLRDMWEVVDTFGVYFDEDEFRRLVNAPDLFALLLQAERRVAAAGNGGVDDWDWRESFLEGQALVRDDIRTVCLSSIRGSSIASERGTFRRRQEGSELKLPRRLELVKSRLV